jgi:hypothetical protein
MVHKKISIPPEIKTFYIPLSLPSSHSAFLLFLLFPWKLENDICKLVIRKWKLEHGKSKIEIGKGKIGKEKLKKGN